MQNYESKLMPKNLSRLVAELQQDRNQTGLSNVIRFEPSYLQKWRRDKDVAFIQLVMEESGIHTGYFAVDWDKLEIHVSSSKTDEGMIFYPN
jgi:hypothetical protein